MAFSFDLIENFDEHIHQSIPNYDTLHGAIVSMAPYFLNNEALVDIGCSTGKLLEAISYSSGQKIGIDNSRLIPETKDDITYIQADLETYDDYPVMDLALSVFTLQFLDRKIRKQVVQRIYDNLTPGGAFIVAEKVYAETGREQEIFNFSHYDYKLQNFTPQQILKKERDLRAMLKPDTRQENLDRAYEVGFSESHLFWKTFNFEAHLLIKGENE